MATTKKSESKKPKLYIIHGWTYTTEPWRKTLDQLQKLGLDFEMLHVPGLTASSNKVWTIDDYVKWADRRIPDGAVALGHSNGGRILLNLCAENPEKLSHLILLDSAGVYEPSAKRSTARRLSKVFRFLKKIPGLTKVWRKLTGATDYAKAPENMKKTLTNMLDSDKRLRLSKVTTPTTILWGESDNVTPPRQAKIMAEKIPHSRLELFPGWTHAPYISHPLELARVIFRTVKQPPEQPAPVNVMETVPRSASMNLKKASGPKIPNTAELSAALSLKKAGGEIAKIPQQNTLMKTDSSKKAALLDPSAPHSVRKVVDQLAVTEYEKTDFAVSSDASPVVLSSAERRIISGATAAKPAKAPAKSTKNPKGRQ